MLNSLRKYKNLWWTNKYLQVTQKEARLDKNEYKSIFFPLMNSVLKDLSI